MERRLTDRLVATDRYSYRNRADGAATENRADGTAIENRADDSR